MNERFLAKWIAKSSLVVLALLVIAIGASLPKDQIFVRAFVVMLGMAINLRVAEFRGWEWKPEFSNAGPIAILVLIGSLTAFESLGYMKGWLPFVFLFAAFIISKAGLRRRAE